LIILNDLECIGRLLPSFFNPDKYNHVFQQEKSFFLILNKDGLKKDKALLEKVITMFGKFYGDIDDFLMS
jgi:hypothetical protein